MFFGFLLNSFTAKNLNMNIRIAFLILLISCYFKVFSQETTKGDVQVNNTSNKNSVLIIPFEPRLYISDIDNSLAKDNGMTYQDIKAKFRAGLDQNIFIELKPYYNALSFYTVDEQEARTELSYIYNSIGYKYEVLETEEQVDSKGKKLLNKFKKDEKKEDFTEAGVQNGQVVSQVDNREKYMKTVLSNTELITNLNKKYQAEYYIFINELDIKRGTEGQYLGGKENTDREIKVHYTIFDKNEKEVASGAIKTTFSSSEDDINKIIKSEFPLIAEKIVQKMIVQ